MKNTNTMRRVAGVLYFIAFAAEMYLFRPLYAAYSLMAVPVMVNALLIAAVGAGAVWMLAGQGFVNKTAARAVCVATALVVVKSLVMYELENELLGYSLAELLPSLAESNIWNYVIIVLRLMLLIVAAFFMLTASEEPQAAAGNSAGEQDDEADKAAGEKLKLVVEIEEKDSDDEEEDTDRLDEIESGMDPALPGNDR